MYKLNYEFQRFGVDSAGVALAGVGMAWLVRGKTNLNA